MAIGLSLNQLRAVYEHESGVTGTVNEYVKVANDPKAFTDANGQ